MEKKVKRCFPAALTDLPDIAIDEILCRMPFKDVVRTSVLSRFWRHRWESIPDLDFRWVLDPFVFQSLLFHSGSIRSFAAISSNPANVLVWLNTLGRRASSSLEYLSLHGTGTGEDGLSLDFNWMARSFPRLTKLSLEACDLHMIKPRSSDLAALKDLSLAYCPFYGDGIPGLFAAFPRLEALYLENVAFEEPNGSITIVAPSLRKLTISDCYLRNDLSIVSAPVLEEAVIDLYTQYYDDGGDGGVGQSCNIMKLFGDMPRIRTLTVSADLLQYLATGNLPQTRPLSFDHLRDMELEVNFVDAKQLLALLCMLNCSPNLQKLQIESCVNENGDHAFGEEFWKPYEHAKLFNKLETLNMRRMWNIDVELQFLKFVLAKALMLKKLLVDTRNGMDKESMENILGSFMVANQAQILFQ